MMWAYFFYTDSSIWLATKVFQKKASLLVQQLLCFSMKSPTNNPKCHKSKAHFFHFIYLNVLFMSHILAQQNISLLMVFDVLVTFTLCAGVILYYLEVGRAHFFWPGPSRAKKISSRASLEPGNTGFEPTSSLRNTNAD